MREQLQRDILKISDDLRGEMSGWDFKQYILGFLFYRYLSEVEVQRGFQLDDDYKYKTVMSKKGSLTSNIQEAFEKIINSIEHLEQRDAFESALLDINLNSKQLGENKDDKVLNIMEGVLSIDIGTGSDVFGDVYEATLMMYSNNAGNQSGEYYTPLGAAKLLMKIASHNRKPDSIYDPTTGSGGLLLQGKDYDVKKYYGQELNSTTYNIARINLYLNGVDFEDINIKQGDTLLDDKLKDEHFDVIVSNPPYSVKWDQSSVDQDDERYKGPGVLAPKSKADYAFILHSLHHLKETGRAAIIVYPGLMYRGGAEAKIRRWLLEQNHIASIIQLPENIFTNTTISTTIMVIEKDRAEDAPIRFIDASNIYQNRGKYNVITDQDVDEIFELFANEETKEYLSHDRTLEEIKEEGYNLTVRLNIPQPDRPVIDIVELEKEIYEAKMKRRAIEDELDAFIENEVKPLLGLD